MKNIIISILRNLLKVFFIFPIKKNRVFFSAYSGKSYSCNPKYITEWLLNNQKEDMQIIWAFINLNKFTDLDSRIKKVRFKSLKYLYYLLTSNVVVDNVESWSILPQRKGQFTINTWHGGGSYKGVGLKRLDTTDNQNKNMLNKNKRISLYVSSSKTFTEQTLRSSFGYEGDVIECGMPRNDILINSNEDISNSVKRELGLSGDDKIVIYAPTFRNDLNYHYDLDCESVLQALKERFGGNWKMLYRLHYYVSSSEKNNNVIDVSDYPDMQKLLIISDILITDYSSSIWDFSLMFKPAFLYTPDLDDYNGERDFYSPISEWPYPYSTSNDDLILNILNFDKEKSDDKIKRHHNALNNCESGNASETIGKIIIDKCS